MLARMRSRIFLGCVATVLASCGGSEPPAERLPNFVVIMADDLGYGDTGVYGSMRNETPHIDRLAREGLRFTDFHSNGPMCTPTRAALLTGRYQNRLGPDFEGPLSGVSGHDNGMPHEQVTIAEGLAEAGYVSGAYGKWHLGYKPPFLPTSQGFEEFWGLGSGDGDHHSHVDRSGRRDWWHNDEQVAEAGYTAELVTNHAIEFVERNKDRPFFLYVAHLAIHFPWQGPGDEGFREEGGDYNSLVKLGYFEEDKDPSGKVKEMVEAVDASVGRIVEALEANGLAEDTLVVFTSDNGGYLTYEGGYHNISSNGPLRGQKAQVYEGGIRVPAVAWWPGRIRPAVTDEIAASFDWFPTFLELAGLAARDLDGTSLAPLLFEGGSLAERTLFWRMRDRRAVRRGEWKLVAIGENDPELYDLGEDVGEAIDLAGKRPDVVDGLIGELEAWQREVDGK